MPFIKNVAILAKKVADAALILPKVSAGQDHTLFIKTTGRAWSWGANTFGALGTASTTSRITPVSVVGTIRTFCEISAAVGNSFAIDKNGRLWSWGSNSFGSLGINSTTSQTQPVSVLGAVKTFCQISGGNVFALAIDKNGQAWGWGYSADGRTGIGITTDVSTPVAVAGATKTFCKISGRQHSLAIDKNGRAWAWGTGNLGQLGDNGISQRLTPVSVAGAIKTFCEIAGGSQHSLAIDKNGRIWSWGGNSSGELGDNTLLSKRTPVSIAGAVKTFCKIFAGQNYSVAIDKNGQAWGWGTNPYGQLGINTRSSTRTPVSVAGQKKTFCSIAASTQAHTLAIDKNGGVWAWGLYTSGQLGSPGKNRFTPMSVIGAVKTFCKIEAGASANQHTMAIDKNGRVWVWGRNVNGKLGVNDAGSLPTDVYNFGSPVSVLGAVKTFCQIRPAANHSVSIDKNGRAWGWGNNDQGQLGNNSTTQRNTPVSVLGATKTFCQITAGQSFTLAIEKNGRVWGWGINDGGQLGDNTILSKRTPVAIAGATKTFCQITAGDFHSFAVDNRGRGWSWGYNFFGELGDNSTISKSTPVSVVGATKTFCQIASGFYNSAAIDKNGRVWTWGINQWAQLGNASNVSQLTPVSILGAVKTFCKISVGSFHMSAIDKNGRVWSWGRNSNGQLGDNSIAARNTPVSVLGAIKTFCQISAGNNYTIAVDKNGRSWGWGEDIAGQLGLGTQMTLTPISICIP